MCRAYDCSLLSSVFFHYILFPRLFVFFFFFGKSYTFIKQPKAKRKKIIEDGPRPQYSTNTGKIQPIQNIFLAQNQTLENGG